MSLNKSRRSFTLLFATGLCLSLVVSACTPKNSPNLQSDRAITGLIPDEISLLLTPTISNPSKQLS